MKQNRLLLTLAACTAITATTANATLIAYEGFDYSLGSADGLGSAADAGWGGSWTAGNANIVTGSLGGTTDATLPTTGNSLDTDFSSRVGRAFDTSYSDASSQEIWMSFLYASYTASFTYNAFELSGTAGGLPGDADRVFQLGNFNSGTEIAMRVNNDAGTNTSLLSTTGTFTGPQFFVLKFDLVNGGDDTISAWVNPDVAALAGPATASITTASLGSFSAVDVAAFGFGDTFLDEFRMGTTLADVTTVPEPSAYGLLAGALALGWVMVRRRA